MVRTINTIENPVLFREAKSIPDPKNLTNEEQAFIADLWDTFNSLESALGLAANQIWKPEHNLNYVPAVFIASIDNIPTLFINPEIISGTGGTLHNAEACFSIPDCVCLKVHRKRNILISYDDDSPDQKRKYQQFQFKENQMNPMVLQHEYDHLKGQVIKNGKK